MAKLMVCKATVRACRYGADPHFDSIENAERAIKYNNGSIA